MQILYVGTDDQLDWTRKQILSHAGYVVRDVRNRAETEALAKEARLALFSNLLAKSERDAVAEVLSSQYPNILRLAFESKDTTPQHGELLPRQLNPDAFLKLVGTAMMRQHQHPEVVSKYFLYVDYRRRYTHVSDGVCEMLGFGRAEIIGQTIDWLTYEDSEKVPALFDEYLKATKMTGTYAVRSKNGQPVRVNFKATVLADGCLCSELLPECDSFSTVSLVTL